MDICSDNGSSATDNINDHHGLYKNTVNRVLKPLPVDELSVNATKFLNIQDSIEEDSTSSTPHKSSEFPKKDSCEKFSHGKITTDSPEKCSINHAPLGKTISHQDVITSESSKHGDNICSNDPSGFSSMSLPWLNTHHLYMFSHTHLKPVSAMKGSREKRGVTPPMKLTVKWAPDVYDPIPTSVSHVSSNRSSSKHSKKNSKNKQKNGSKSSRGSKSKDKKQVRKRGGSSATTYKFEHEEGFVDFHEQKQQPGGIDFHVGNPDQLCGSSFMKGYGTSLHISSVAEAT